MSIHNKANYSTATRFTLVSLVLFTALPASAEIVKPTDKSLMTTTLKPFYPIFNPANQCQGAIAGSGAGNGKTDEAYKMGYCVKVDSQRLVDTPNGKRLYVLTTGDIGFDEKGEKAYGAHVFMGLVGMFVLKPHGNDWQVESANPYINAGASGEGLKNWKLRQFSPKQWGFINEHGDGHFGVSGTDYLILTPNGKAIQQSWIGASFSNSGRGECSKNKKDAYCMDMTTDFNIDNTRVVNGYYPVVITLNGIDGKVKYHNKRYRINYTPKKGYVEPKAYPLKNLDY